MTSPARTRIDLPGLTKFKSGKVPLQALLVDPVINSADAAVRLLDELWEANRPYIRNCLGA